MRAQLNTVVFLALVLLQSSCDRNLEELSCQIVLKVSSEEFYEGCTIPITVLASEGTNTVGEVEIFINGESLGMKESYPHISYWETKDYPPGDYRLRASFKSHNGNLVQDEIQISILPVHADCPDYVTDFEGNRYSVVQIGKQCWMGENLRSTIYANGDSLRNANSTLGDSVLSSFSQIHELLIGWYISYEADPLMADLYGYLYTWPTVVNGTEALKDSTGYIQGIAPDGWHVPEVEEWRALIDYLGGVELAGSRLKDQDSPLWHASHPGSSTASVFKALPGGCSLHIASYIEEGESSYFYTATPTIPNHAYHILLSNYNSRANVLGHQDSYRFGYSVRCLMNGS